MEDVGVWEVFIIMLYFRDDFIGLSADYRYVDPPLVGVVMALKEVLFENEHVFGRPEEKYPDPLGLTEISWNYDTLSRGAV